MLSLPDFLLTPGDGLTMQGGVEQEHTYCSNERDAFMPGAGMRFGLVAGG